MRWSWDRVRAFLAKAAVGFIDLLKELFKQKDPITLTSGPSKVDLTVQTRTLQAKLIISFTVVRGYLIPLRIGAQNYKRGGGCISQKGS